MELTKRIKKYGNSYIITITPEDRELMKLQEGDIVKIEFKAVYKDDVGLPTPPEIDDRARYRTWENGE